MYGLKYQEGSGLPSMLMHFCFQFLPCFKKLLINREVLDGDFHYPTETKIYRIPDSDVRTVRHLDN